MPKSPLSFYLHIIAVAVIVFALANWFGGQNSDQPASSAKTESTYDRIMRTGVIRCGYMIWPPSLIKDANTGQLSGVMYDYLNALGEIMDLKVEWVEELNLSTYIQDLNSHKYDVECSGGWPNGKRGKQLEYTNPIYYFPIVAVVRIDDHRFDTDLRAIDDPAVRVVTVDGETSEQIRNRRFPKSQAVSLPSLVPITDTMVQVETGKADVALRDIAGAMDYINANPGKLRILKDRPVRTIPNNVSFAKGEYELQQMLNTATGELMNDGAIDSILDKYETTPGLFLRAAKPYQ